MSLIKVIKELVFVKVSLFNKYVLKCTKKRNFTVISMIHRIAVSYYIVHFKESCDPDEPIRRRQTSQHFLMSHNNIYTI